MGRPRLPLACSKCGRTPKEVKINSNRYCVDCMRSYNKQQRARRIQEGRELTGYARQGSIEVLGATEADELGYYDDAGNWVSASDTPSSTSSSSTPTP